MTINAIKLAVVFLFTLTLAACAESRVEPLKVGATVWVGYEPLYLGREQGFLVKEDFHLVEFLSASQVMRSFRNKTIDVAALTLDEVLLLENEGVNPVVFLVLDVSNGADAIMAGKQFRTIEQLRGRKIGYENTAVGAYMLSRALQKNNIKVEDVTLVSVNVNETETYLMHEKVDAVVTFEPFRTRLLEKGYSEIFSSREIPNEIVDVLVVRKEALSKFKDQMLLLKNGWYKSLEYYKQNKKDALDVMNKRLKLPEKSLIAAFNGVSFPSREESLSMLGSAGREGGLVSVVKKLSEKMVQHKLLAKEVDPARLFENAGE